MAKKNKHNEKVGSTVERDDSRIKQTGEVFTPMELVYRMIADIPAETLSNPDSTFLDNSCGSGNFLFGLLTVLTEQYGHSPEHVRNNMLFGIDLMEDNINETRQRLGVSADNPHFVCANALTYDYSFGQPTGVELLFV